MLKKLIKNKKILIGIILLFIVFITYILRVSLSAEFENDVEVRPESDLTYYLNISYDGIDKYGFTSSDEKIASVNSGIIYVEDVLPEGLTFNGFVESTDGTFGATNRNNDGVCPGYVVDDSEDFKEGNNNYHGLHYDSTTRKVTFKVKNLQAGCVLTIGIKTVTPPVDDPDTEEKENRRDFYNFATGKEGALTVNSNTVHVWMGDEKVELFTVTYKYDDKDAQPGNRPQLPSSMQYMAGSKVGVASDVNIEGYTFSGWKSSDVTINSDGTFTMPSKNVTLVGSFTENPKYNVTYRIDGEMPEDYVLPLTKEYYKGATVKLDSTRIGEVFGNYRFLGWIIEDNDINKIDGEYFEMPDKNVTIVGKFEEMKYNVEYKFQGKIIPPEADELLPDTKEYSFGSEVSLEEVKDIPDGYDFLGWYSDDTFTMPAEDVTIYGEWKELSGYFRPDITKEIINKKDYYYPGDIVEYKIMVTNNEDFDLTDVYVKENNENAYFTMYYDDSASSDLYFIESSNIVRIPNLKSKSSVQIRAVYHVTDKDRGTIKNEVEIIGASTKNNYELDIENGLTASASFETVASLTIEKKVNGNYDDKVFNIKIEGNNFSSTARLKRGESRTFYLKPGDYKVTEIIPQEYNLVSVEGIINSNAQIFKLDNKDNYKITFTNEFVKKGFFHASSEIVNKINHKVYVIYYDYDRIEKLREVYQPNYIIKPFEEVGINEPVSSNSCSFDIKKNLYYSFDEELSAGSILNKNYKFNIDLYPMPGTLICPEQ